jgi:hypothetical protein
MKDQRFLDGVEAERARCAKLAEQIVRHNAALIDNADLTRWERFGHETAMIDAACLKAAIEEGRPIETTPHWVGQANAVLCEVLLRLLSELLSPPFRSPTEAP